MLRWPQKKYVVLSPKSNLYSLHPPPSSTLSLSFTLLSSPFLPSLLGERAAQARARRPRPAAPSEAREGRRAMQLQSLQLLQRGAAEPGMGRSSKLCSQWSETELNSCFFFYWVKCSRCGDEQGGVSKHGAWGNKLQMATR